ncbi:helix-turn-helix domain-containing protein [Chryseobacterium daecheongense]|uniref:helix-turn-helix domain-containing protein n=1 Tax=Chryseobacterium daecheongense TaxID=192389 RepID=UPI001FD6B844|nr:helix-turn-helix transcriptional regulator [Chryseobacterium daecheongense]UOU98765.1 helix-turn-helix domain-containing protein [Chryseobacterium daecheongense]
MRKEKGFSQEKMAQILSLNTSNYSRKERGETRIYDEEWERIAKALNVSVDEIKGNADTKPVIQDENLNFHNHSGSNSNYTVPDSVLTNFQDYINLLKEQNQALKDQIYDLKEENKLLKSKI